MMNKLLLVLSMIALSACTWKNDMTGRAMPKEAKYCKVYNGGGLVLDMKECKFTLQTVKNEVVIGNGENWLIYTIDGIDKTDNKQHTYNMLDSEALTIIWE